MKRRIVLHIVAAVSFMGVAAVCSDAAMFFTDTFTGGPSANWTNTGIADFSGDNATLPSATRDHMRTVDADYFLTDFVFEVTVDVPGGGPEGTAFIGMGPGMPDAGAFGEPDQPHVFADIGPDGFANGFFRSRDNGVASGLQGQGTGWSSGLHRVRMTWTAASGTALFEVDKDYDGVNFVMDHAVSENGLDNGFDAASSRLYIGGGDGVVYDDVVVIPEPATGVLGALGLLVLMLRRRFA